MKTFSTNLKTLREMQQILSFMTPDEINTFLSRFDSNEAARVTFLNTNYGVLILTKNASEEGSKFTSELLERKDGGVQ